MLEAKKIVEALKRAAIEFVIFLPDRVTSRHLLPAIMADPYFRTVQICKEDEGVSICSGLYVTGHRALLLIQHTGLLDSVNALRGVAVELKNPVIMMVGLLGKEPGIKPKEAKRYGVRIVEPLLDVMGIGHELIEENKDTEKIVPAIEETYRNPSPFVFLIGREPL